MSVGDTTGVKHAGELVREALEILAEYGTVEGEHHQRWVLDQVVRTLLNCPMVKQSATDYKGTPYTYEDLGINDAYVRWVHEIQWPDGEDGEEYPEWDEGIAP